MPPRDDARPVYSTEAGRLCPDCGAPAAACRCASGDAEAVPLRIVATLRMEKAGRGGKTVTVVAGLPRNPGFLKALCVELKRVCGSGGAVGDGTVEIQGEARDRVRAYLRGKGYGVKG
ncbi:MAG: stress response translation initiation inhibitor YciH [Vicinamibacteraceae bacterium]